MLVKQIHMVNSISIFSDTKSKNQSLYDFDEIPTISVSHWRKMRHHRRKANKDSSGTNVNSQFNLNIFWLKNRLYITLTKFHESAFHISWRWGFIALLTHNVNYNKSSQDNFYNLNSFFPVTQHLRSSKHHKLAHISLEILDLTTVSVDTVQNVCSYQYILLWILELCPILISR